MKIIKISILLLLTINLKANVKEVRFHQFLNYIEKNELTDSQIEVKFEGEFMCSPISEEEFLYYEAVAFFGEKDIKSSYSILFDFDKNFYLIFKDMKVKVSQRHIRTFLEPTYSEKITKSYKDKSSIQYKILESMKDHDSILLEEYGLQKNKTYYMMLHTDSYQIESGDGKIKTRNNIVIHISDKEFKDKKAPGKLTPVYQGWTY